MSAKVTIKNNGSIRIEGEFEIVDQEGRRFDLGGRLSVSLCRCGHSRNKPFCDHAHREVNFASEICAFALPPPQPKPKP